VTQPELARRLGTADAVLIGLGSMIGAGVFAAFSPAAAAAGVGLLLGLVIAAVVAYCNATASAQLAAQYPTSGGTYIYGRERLGPWWGFLAGWGFVIGKTASCAAMALTFASYAAPSGWQRPLGIAAVLLLAAVNYRGVSRTAAATRIIVALVLAALAIAVTVALATGDPDPNRITGQLDDVHWSASGGYRVLQSAGLLFFAFAGYARIATLGEEVRDPGEPFPGRSGSPWPVRWWCMPSSRSPCCSSSGRARWPRARHRWRWPSMPAGSNGPRWWCGSVAPQPPSGRCWR
jgi:APA family basic amino acid/polyamine antiporter